MIRFDIIRKVRTLLVDGNRVIFSNGNSVYETLNQFGSDKFLAKFDRGFLMNTFARNRWLARLLRLGFHGLYNFKGDIIGIQRGHIVLNRKGEKNFISVFQGFRGSRPLSLLITPDLGIFFGEYFGNKQRLSVYIYHSKDGLKWDKVYCFPAGAVRHIHGMTWDPFQKGIWVQTGDSNNESGLWFTSDCFKSLTKFSDYSQRIRAVEIIPLDKDHLIVPMDSPLEKNYIHILKRNSLDFKQVASLPGSAFHAIKFDEIFLVSTVTEPSDINQPNSATIFASLDGIDWKLVLSLKRDIIPVALQKYFGYSELFFSQQTGDNSKIFVNARAIKGVDNSTLAIEKASLFEALRNKSTLTND